MANNHGYISTMRCVCENVDAYNCVGIKSDGAVDNGCIVTLGEMQKDGVTKVVHGYEFKVTLGTADAKYADAWVVATPEVGTTIEMQSMSDPRYFYNEAGKPMSLKKLHADVDVIEVDANCFTNKQLPEAVKTMVGTDANGKLKSIDAKPAAGVMYFDILGFNEVAVGHEIMKTVLLRCRVA